MNIFRALLLSVVASCCSASEFNDGRPQTSPDNYSIKRVRYSDISEIQIDELALNLQGSLIFWDESMVDYYDSILKTMDGIEIHKNLFNLLKNGELEALKQMHRLGLLRNNLKPDHIDYLYINWTVGLHFEILKFLLNACNDFIRSCIDEEIGSWIIQIMLKESLENFEFFWNKFELHSLSEVLSSDLLFRSVQSFREDIFNFVLNKLTFMSSETCNIRQNCLNMAFRSALIANDSRAWTGLLEMGASYDNLSSMEQVLLIRLATNSKNCDLVKNLLKKPAFRIQAFTMSRGPWIAAVDLDCPEMVQVYIDSCLVVKIENVVNYAFIKKKMAVLHYLISKGYMSSSKLYSYCCMAVERNDLGSFKLAVMLGCDIRRIDEKGFDILASCVIRDRLDFIDHICSESNCNLEMSYRNFCFDNTCVITPIIYLAKSKEMARKLVNYGAEVNAEFQRIDIHGEVIQCSTALQLAIYKDNNELIEELISLGADVTIPNSIGYNSDYFMHLAPGNV